MMRLLDTLAFTLGRIRQHAALVLWVVLGISVATTLALALPLYVDSVYSNILESRLDDPPFAYRFRYLGAWNGNIGRADVVAADASITQNYAERLGLPVYQYVRYARGGTWNTRLAESKQVLGALGVSYLEGNLDRMRITGGAWPPDGETASGAIPVLVPEAMLWGKGAQLGDVIEAQRAGSGLVTFEVVAIWEPYDAEDPAWVFPPKFFDEVMLVQEADLWALLEGIDAPIDESAWYLVFDGGDLRTSDIDTLLGDMRTGQRAVEAALPGIRNDVSPEEELTAFNNEVNQLTQQLFIIILPVGGLVLYFVSLVSNLLVNRQQTEDVKLRSRGMSRWGVLWIHLLMWLLIVGTALAAGIAASPSVVRLVGQTSSFLRFDGVSSLQAVVYTPEAIAVGAITGLIAASSGLWLAWRTTSRNINNIQQESDITRRAWWQRSYIDVLILGLALYVLYSLSQQGGLVATADNPFSDPLTFIGPTLFALGLTMAFLRLYPFLLNLAGRLVTLTASTSLLMSLREITRSIGRYRGALMMMSFTLSLTGFTASMASTLDQSLVDAINYGIGADLVLQTATDAETETSTDDSGNVTLTITGYNAPPVEEIQPMEGVRNVSRAGVYRARLAIGSGRPEGVVMGVDRAALPDVIRWRGDYASTTPAELFNQLAGNRTGVIIDRRTLETYNLSLGQEITMQVEALGEWYESRVPIVDVIDYFPTLDPRKSFLLITNIDPLFETAGTALPHDIWIGLDSTADVPALEADVEALGFPVRRWLDPEAALLVAQADPSRRGVLGFLSVGFVASIALTLIGTIIQNTAGFRSQSAQLGTLRAMGLGSLAVSLYVILIQSFVAIGGILSGTTIGILTTALFLPLLDFSGGLPPYLVRVAWNEILVVYAIFAAVLFFVTMATSLLLSREQVATVVKLGEA
jgi:putative ABC transport system permease protein